MSLFSLSAISFFRRPLGLVPVTVVRSVLFVMCVSSRRITCPYHDSRFCVRTEFIGVTFAFPLMVSFLILSFPVFLDSTLAFSFRWYVNVVPLACAVPNTHSRRPYTIAGRTTVLHCLLFSFTGTFLSVVI